LASVYAKEDGGSDAAVWLGASKEEVVETRLYRHSSAQAFADVEQSSVGHYTVEALRGIGLLDELIETSEGLVVYPAALAIED